jgi:DNA-binding NtrC family response regulator
MKETTSKPKAVQYVYERACLVGLDSALLEIEKAVVKKSAKAYATTEIAGAILGIKRTTMYAKRKRYGF